MIQARDALGKMKEDAEALNEWRAHKEKVMEFFEKETEELKHSWRAIEEEKARLNLFRKNLDEKYHKLKKERETTEQKGGWSGGDEKNQEIIQ